MSVNPSGRYRAELVPQWELLLRYLFFLISQSAGHGVFASASFAGAIVAFAVSGIFLYLAVEGVTVVKLREEL